MGDGEEIDWGELDGTLNNVLEQKSLKWIFVGGKGGVGKTTTSSSLAVALSKVRTSVLLISTDPAHNLSDAFGQKFTKVPTLVEGFKNLAVMEIDPTVELETGDALDSQSQALLSEITSAIPGIDEAMSFGELMKQVQGMDYEVIVFDTAPTGHTLRLLSFPTTLEKAFTKFMQVKDKFSGVLKNVSSVFGGGFQEEKVFGKLEVIKATVAEVNKQFRDPTKTTFVCVCIPEFLSLYETERLVQELSKYSIDTHNIVVNQVLYADHDSKCRKCIARMKMQQKYLDQFYELYGDAFHVILMPLLDEEVRGKDLLEAFSKRLLQGHDKPVIPTEGSSVSSSSASSSSAATSTTSTSGAKASPKKKKSVKSRSKAGGKKKKEGKSKET